MEMGVGLDATLGLSFEEQRQVSQDAARMGYTHIWTNEGTGHDSFHICALRWEATRDIIPGGVTTGIAVSPVAYRSPIAFAMSAGTVSELTGGKFILGIGSGGANLQERQRLGLSPASPLALMRQYLTDVKGLLAGKEVAHQGRAVRLGINPPRTPVHLAALGPEMLRLSGELADGACLNWCSAEQIAWSRERIAEGARKAGRDPSSIQVVEYIRVCVDDDVDAARRAFARATMGYALGPRILAPGERPMGYRAHFERMGFAKELAELDRMRAKKASQDEIADAFPVELLRHVGYFGKAQGAKEAFQRLAKGLDVAIVRVVAARRGIEGVRATMRACI